jgi:MFS family permease
MLLAGGQWAAQLPPAVQRNLRWFLTDGLFAQVAESISLAYLSLYVLSLGATRGQIGLMTSLASLSAALLLLPGAGLARRADQRQRVALASGTAARAALLLLALIPFAFSGQTLVTVAIALAVIRETLANLALPAWTALTGDIVPLAWRGRYFGMRNMAMGVVGITTTLLVGRAIVSIGGESGYQWALIFAFITGLAATFSFAQIEPPVVAAEAEAVPGGGAPLLQRLRANRQFIAFCGAAAVWNFSLYVAGPFFNVYVVERLGGDALSVGWLSVVSSIAALPGQRIFGALTDRWGPRRVQLATTALIPILPIAWLFVREPWHVVPINLLAGFLWAGYLIASLNYLLILAPQDERARFSAVHQMVVMGSLAAGAAVGGWVVTEWGYLIVFMLSGIGRWLAALVLWRFTRAAPPAAMG